MCSGMDGFKFFDTMMASFSNDWQKDQIAKKTKKKKKKAKKKAMRTAIGDKVR